METVAKSRILDTKVTGVELSAQIGTFQFVRFLVLVDETLDDARTSVVQKTADLLEEPVYWAAGRINRLNWIELVGLMKTEHPSDR